MVQSVPAGVTVKVVVPVDDCGARTVVVDGVASLNSQTPEPVAASRKLNFPSDLQLVLMRAVRVKASATPRLIEVVRNVFWVVRAAVKPCLACHGQS